MKKQSPTYVAHSADGDVVLRLLGKPSEDGTCKVKVLKTGCLEDSVRQGDVINDFAFLFGGLKFEKNIDTN